MARTRSRYTSADARRDYKSARARSVSNLNRLEAERQAAAAAEQAEPAESPPLPRFYVIGNPDRGFAVMDGATERIAVRLATTSRDLAVDEAAVLNGLDERTPLREAEELWNLAHGGPPKLYSVEWWQRFGTDQAGQPACGVDGESTGNDEDCRFAMAEPTFHHCTNGDGQPVRPGQSCWAEARASLLEAELDPDEQRDYDADSGAYDDEAVSAS